MKTIAFIYLIHLLMISGCHSGQTVAGDNSQKAEIYLNGKLLNLTDEKNLEIIEMVISLFEGCDEFYELLITENLLQTIKENEQYLEICFPEVKNVKTEKYGDIEFDKILIPLTGKFANNDQLTFFSGKTDFSNTPLIKSTGLGKLRELLDM